MIEAIGRTSMTKDEALKLALEALEKSHTCPLLPDDCAEAITAIKEALAQPEHGWTPERIAGIARLKDVQDKKLAQPEQEPYWERVARIKEEMLRVSYEENKLLKEALAQPEPWEKFCDSNCVWTDHHPDCKLAEQEPVAWMDDYNACKCPDNEARCFSDKVFRMMQKHTDSLTKRQEPVAKVCHDLDGHIGWNPNLKQLPNEGTPLYTTPPQRKPLTRKEVLTIIDKHPVEKKTGLPMFYRDQVLDIARAIEAAHGIKGEA